MRIELFHIIGEGGSDSAEVRRFVLEQAIKDKIEFRNLAYEEARQALREAGGIAERAPWLLTSEGLLDGKRQVLDWLIKNKDQL